MAVVAGWGLVVGLFAILGLRDARSWRPAGLAVGAAAFVATFAAVYGITGKRNSFLLYGSDSGERYGDLLPAEVAEIPTFDLALVPIKVAQIFLDPCFYSLCELHEYAGIREAWRQPLAVQLPCPRPAAPVRRRARRSRRQGGAAQGARVGVGTRAPLPRRAHGRGLGVDARLRGELVVRARRRLRFGFARDFLLPFLLTGVVVVTLGFAALHRFVTRREPAPDAGVPGGAPYLGRGGGERCRARGGNGRRAGLRPAAARQPALRDPRVPGGRATVRRCAVEVVAANPSGNEFSVPGASLLTFGCGSDEPRLSIHVPDPGGEFDVPATCSEPRLVAAWPATMGVPPNSAVLRSVDVTNSTAG